MTPRVEKIAFAVSLVLSACAALNLWVGAPQVAQLASDWSLDVSAWIELLFRYHKAFVVLPVLVLAIWFLPHARRHRGWACLCVGLLSMLLQTSMWVPVFMAPAITG